MPNKIYLDCTPTYNSGLNTGIQRVVKNIVKHAPEVAKELQIPIVPVVSLCGAYYTFEAFPHISPTKNALKTFLKKIYVSTRAFLDYLLPTALSRMLYHPSLAIFANKVTDKILFSKKREASREVTMRPNDIVILLDSTWLNNNYKQLEELKQNSIKIVAVLYDIIPITHPEFCTIDLTNSLKDWYKKAAPYIDGYIAISKSVQVEIQAYLKQGKFDYFYLGTNFSTEYDEQKVPDSFKNLFKTPNTYLTVSTIEPRKNHAYILDTFDALWQSKEDVTYVMIGREGWNMKHLMHRITTHELYNKKLFLLTDTDDNALVYAYKHAKALLFASHVEGFGLPIIESLFYRLPVIASDTPIHKEIGRENISYFDLANPSSLQHIIQTQNIKPVHDFIWQDWHQSTKELILKSKEI